MILIKSVVFAALVSNCYAVNPLMYHYDPKTEIYDHAAIDMDQKEIETQLSKYTISGILSAKNVYEKGAHSRSYALITLKQPSPRDIPAFKVIRGVNSSGEEVTGTVETAVKKGDKTIKFLYDTKKTLGKHVDCQVGGGTAPKLKGCLAGNGSIHLKGRPHEPLAYTYNPTTDNGNLRKFNKFSQEAADKMLTCTHCPYPDFKKSYDYYGVSDYADKWISAAFDGFETNFREGNVDFSNLSREGRAEAVRVGTVLLNLWMYMIHDMERALDHCGNSCKDDPFNCGAEFIHKWDEAVAYYTGSLQKDGKGYLMYSLAEYLCKHFGTCGDDGDALMGPAAVNLEIFKHFNEGQQYLMKGACSEARTSKESITTLMTVPLVQGTLLYGHLTMSNPDAYKRDKEVGKGLAYAAALLPIMNTCSAEDAAIVQENMNMAAEHDKREGDFVQVKSALERNYACMGITCEDVGGIINKSSNTFGFYKNAYPCYDDEIQASASANSKTKGGRAQAADKWQFVLLFSGLAVVIAVAIITFLFHLSYKNSVKRAAAASCDRDNINANVQESTDGPELSPHPALMEATIA